MKITLYSYIIRKTDIERRNLMNKKVLIAMSGGVDSSVAACLMHKLGYDCIGITMKLHNINEKGEESESSCCTTQDIEDAKSVADTIGIPHSVYNFTDDFKTLVIDKFVNAYTTGSTPNPCIECNRYIKFNRLFKQGAELGIDYIVTGHYARIKYNEYTGRYNLLKAVDSSKDQSYVLYNLTQEQIKHILLPLGEYSKPQIRQMAEDFGLKVANKSDSQDICFIPDGDYASFIERYLGMKFSCGSFVDTDGNVLGEHKGIIRYTIGQRKGLGLSLSAPMYVCKKCLEDNTVVLSSEKELFSKELDAVDLNLISVEEIKEPMRVKARVRYNQKEQAATVWQTGDKSIHVEFDNPQRAITKGQSVVLYDGDIVVGGATII